MSVEAASLEEGKMKLTQMMTAEAVPPMDQIQGMIQTTTYLVA